MQKLGCPCYPPTSKRVQSPSPPCTSTVQRSPIEGWSAYCASKAALQMVTRSVHHELADAAVSSYGFIPGVVDTDMQATIRASGVNEVSRLRREKLAPAQEPARLVALLCLGRPVELRGQDVSIGDAAAVDRIEAVWREDRVGAHLNQGARHSQ